MIGRFGASVGKILTGKVGAYNVALMKTIPDLAQLDRSFFYHYLISGAFQERLTNVAARSAQNGFGKEDIYDSLFPFRRWRNSGRVLSNSDHCRKKPNASLYERKLAALKQSLLHQAFSGEL